MNRKGTEKRLRKNCTDLEIHFLLLLFSPHSLSQLKRVSRTGKGLNEGSEE